MVLSLLNGNGHDLSLRSGDLSLLDGHDLSLRNGHDLSHCFP